MSKETTPDPQTPKEIFEAFVKLLTENTAPQKRLLLLKWTSLQLGLVTATLIGEGEDFEALNDEITEFMKKGVRKYYALKEGGEIPTSIG